MIRHAVGDIRDPRGKVSSQGSHMFFLLALEISFFGNFLVQGVQAESRLRFENRLVFNRIQSGSCWLTMPGNSNRLVCRNSAEGRCSQTDPGDMALRGMYLSAPLHDLLWCYLPIIKDRDANTWSIFTLSVHNHV